MMLVCNDCINMVVRVKEIETECSVLASHLVLASSFEGAAVTDILLLLLAIYSSVNSKLRVILHVATRRILPHVARYQHKYQYHFKS